MAKPKTSESLSQPPQTKSHQNTMNVSALSQQLQQVSVEEKPKSPSTPKRPSSKRKSKSDYTNASSDTSTVQTQPTKQKRSPKAAKVNGVKHLSTPSKPTSIPNSVPQDPATQTFTGAAGVDLAAHYAGPTFHSSPAPSSLPMPSFFASKQKSTLQNGIELESPPEQSTPVKTVRSLDGRNFDDSPLAPFFKADQEEKLRLRNKRATQDIFGSPTLRPSSADGIPDHLNMRSESPLLWNDSPHKPNGGHFDFRNHSTSELPFQMDSEFDNCNPPRNRLVERFRATTEPLSDYRQSPRGRMNFNHSMQRGQQGPQFSLRQESTPQQPNSDLETSTQTLKNLLSIQPLPSPSKSATIGTPSQYSSPSQHHRTQSATQESFRKPTTRPQRIVSSPGVPQPKNDLPSRNKPVLEEDQTTKVEKELRKVLNLS